MRQRSMTMILGGVLALAAGCAHGQIDNPEGWSLMESKHFNVYVGAPRHAVAMLAGLEYAHAGLSSSFFRGVDIPKTDVLFLEEDEFSSLVGFLRHWMTLAKLPSSATTVGANGLLIMRDTGNDHAGAQALAHLFIEKKFPHAPLWFHEGFASYVRTVEYHGNNRNASAACFGVVSGKQDTLIPLEKVANMTWDDYDGDEARSWYSFTNRTLIDYILFGDEGKNREKIGPFVNAMAVGDSLPAALKVVFPGVSLSALDKKLGEHASDVAYHQENGAKWRGMCPLPFEIPPDKAADQGERKISPAPAADIKAMLDAIKKLPKLDGYPPWYPPDVIAKVGG